MTDTESQRKGLRFEVEPSAITGRGEPLTWQWTLIGKDGPVCRSAHDRFVSQANARSDIAKAKGRLKASAFAKVLTVNVHPDYEAVEG